MASYFLSDDAIEDLREVVRYTRKEWGISNKAGHNKAGHNKAGQSQGGILTF